jgi:opacity protein-like surface antigen
MKASVVLTLAFALALLCSFFAAAQTQPPQRSPEAPANSDAAKQHYERGTELYGQYQRKCSEIKAKDCGLSELNGSVSE